MIPPNSVLLDAQRPGTADPAGALLFSGPLRILEARAYGDVPELLSRLDREAAAGNWCAGFISYEAAYGLDPRGFPDPPEVDAPLAWFGVFAEPMSISPGDVDSALKGGRYSLTAPTLAIDHSAYVRQVEAIREHIVEGEVYQINFTTPLRFGLEGDPLGLYADLRRKQRVQYGGIIRQDERWILSLSPELFVRREGDRLSTRPMKGTVRRGPTTAEDQVRAAWLKSDEKNRAENLMIVDLLRNDLSRVSRPGSVRVPSMFDIERYETLWQMTSSIEAETRSGVGVGDVLKALFPCGSVTGAPKRRAMQLIRSLEADPRGVYCGAIGYVEPGGDFQFSVAIRTLEIDAGRGIMGVGSGIVWDSDPESEYRECLLKARFLTDPPRPEFSLIETMRAEDGSIPLLERHLDRLGDSAAYFDFPYHRAAVMSRLEGLGDGSRRVRITLDRHGEVVVTSTALGDEELEIRRVAIFPDPLDREDPFFRHKTSVRDYYDRAHAWARSRGADEAIILNDRGEVADGSFTSVWARMAGRLVTPPLSAGTLPGVYRGHLLDQRDDAAEGIIKAEDLEGAEAIYVSNAVRGLQRVELTR